MTPSKNELEWVKAYSKTVISWNIKNAMENLGLFYTKSPRKCSFTWTNSTYGDAVYNMVHKESETMKACQCYSSVMRHTWKLIRTIKRIIQMFE
jgi:hypothetical protein